MNSFGHDVQDCISRYTALFGHWTRCPDRRYHPFLDTGHNVQVRSSPHRIVYLDIQLDGIGDQYPHDEIVYHDIQTRLYYRRLDNNYTLLKDEKHE